MRVEFEHHGKPVIIYGFEGDHVSEVIQANRNFYEPYMLEFIETLNPAGTVIDVGANIGNHTVHFGLFTDSEQVVAIEPYSKASELLRNNIVINNLASKVTQLTCAAGAINGRTGLKPGRPSNVGNTKLRSGNEIELRRLDDIVGTDEVDLIKIDVQGTELDVLRGATRLLAQSRPNLFIEAAKRSHKRQLDAFLAKYGYAPKQRFNGAATYFYNAEN